MLKKRMAPGRIIALGFLCLILIGSGLLMLPGLWNEGVQLPYINALFTATSCVCVTGLGVADLADTWNAGGQAVLAALIQLGGLGITSVGVGLIILSGKKIGLRERALAKEALNYGSFKGILGLVKTVILMTVTFEAVGMLVSLLVFAGDYPFPRALGISAFHAIASFNNAGFDILGGFQSLTAYRDNVLLNLITCFLIIAGGLGFFVIREIKEKRSFRKFSLHAKVVVTMTGVLLAAGTLLLKLTEDVSWLGAFFNSVSARTAGFATYPLGGFSTVGLLLMVMLMFIGASPGSTGGGIKTTTFFALLNAASAASTNGRTIVFRRRLPQAVVYQAFIIAFLAISTVAASTVLLSAFEPGLALRDLLFEAVSAFATVGFSTGITPELSTASKLVLIVTMFIGRLGPLTIASLWIKRQQPAYSYPEEGVMIG